MGDGQVSVRTDRDVDDYTRVHTSAEHFGEVLDVTISDTRDSESRGYWVRVREIYYSRSAGRKFVKTTRALLPLDGNTAVPGIHQRAWCITSTVTVAGILTIMGRCG